MSNKVSIIMPVYKCEAYIKDSILSVQNQTYKNFELICINDGTPDNAFEICKEMQAQYGNITLLENEKNMGLEYTRNHGISKAQGDYILFLDSDDLLLPETLEELVSAADKSNTNIVFFSFARIIGENAFPCTINGVPEGLMPIAQFVSYFLREMDIGLMCCVGAKFYRADFLREHNLLFDKQYKYNEDGAFFFQALLKIDEIYVINKPYYRYFIRNAGSIMSSYRPNMFFSILKTRELIKKIFIENDLWDNKVKQTDYYQHILAHMLSSLVNEYKFGTKKSFVAACVDIRSYNEFDTMYSCLRQSSQITKAQKLILPFLKRKCWFIVRLFVKLHQENKKKEK